MHIKDKKILITGGAGFIGHHLVKRLAPNNQLTILDNYRRGIPRRLDEIKDIDLLNIDITDSIALNKINDQYDILIHLAAINGTSNFYDRPIEVMDVGVKGIINILDFCTQKNIKKVIVASSAEVYQAPKVIPTPEDVELIVPTHTNPRYSYGLSKIFTEFYSMHYSSKNKDISISIFRPHNVYGEDMGYKHVIPEIILQFFAAHSADKKSIEIVPKGPVNSERSFCYISDILDGIELISDRSVQGVFNIGNPVSTKIIDIFNYISTLTNINYSLKASRDEHPGSVARRIPDIKKISYLGYIPKVDINSGLHKTLDWYFSNESLIKNEMKNIYL